MPVEKFAFGKNWRQFVQKHLDQESLKEAMISTAGFMRSADMTGKTFVDVGCGSGLFSLCAVNLGASRVVSFDIDPDSVQCANYLKNNNAYAGEWEILLGSVLDEDFLTRLGQFDIVYAWGVLHHTGNMWRAVENILQLVVPGGLLYTSIYNKAEAFGVYPDGRIGPSSLWVRPKKTFCRLPERFQDLAVGFTLLLYCLWCLFRLRNPSRAMIEHKRLRGMSVRTDIRDWLGGYPYEFAAVDEVFAFVTEKGFCLSNLRCHSGLMCNEFLFRRCAASTAESKDFLSG